MLAAKLFGSIPGRAIRGRWTSLDSVEIMIIACGVWLSKTLAVALSRQLKKDADVVLAKEEAAVNDVDLDENIRFKLEQKAYRANSVVLACSCLFRAMVIISHRTKGPVTRFIFWAQKVQGEFNDTRPSAAREGKTYLGPRHCPNLSPGNLPRSWRSFDL